MSVEVILNVEADRLAGEYQDELGAYSPITHMYPLSPVVLEINGMTITSNIHHHLIKAYSEPKYIHYLQQKNTWNNNTVNSIACKCLNLGLQRMLVKICKDLLTIATTLLKWEWQDHKMFRPCGQSETRDHMIRCKAMTRIKSHAKSAR